MNWARLERAPLGAPTVAYDCLPLAPEEPASDVVNCLTCNDHGLRRFFWVVGSVDSFISVQRCLCTETVRA